MLNITFFLELTKIDLYFLTWSYLNNNFSHLTNSRIGQISKSIILLINLNNYTNYLYKSAFKSKCKYTIIIIINSKTKIIDFVLVCILSCSILYELIWNCIFIKFSCKTIYELSFCRYWYLCNKILSKFQYFATSIIIFVNFKIRLISSK